MLGGSLELNLCDFIEFEMKGGGWGGMLVCFVCLFVCLFFPEGLALLRYHVRINSVFSSYSRDN